MSNTNSQIISFLRFPLTFLVVAIHSRGEIGQVPDLMHITARNLYDMVKVLGSDVIAQVAVPSFFFISGYLFFANVSKLDWASYKNMRALVVRVLPMLPRPIGTASVGYISSGMPPRMIRCSPTSLA